METGDRFTCARTTTGNAYCFGGYVDQTGRECLPACLLGISLPFSCPRRDMACLSFEAAATRCRAAAPRCSMHTPALVAQPSPLPALPCPSCAATADYTVGELGQGTFQSSTVPVQVKTAGITPGGGQSPAPTPHASPAPGPAPIEAGSSSSANVSAIVGGVVGGLAGEQAGGPYRRMAAKVVCIPLVAAASEGLLLKACLPLTAAAVAAAGGGFLYWRKRHAAEGVYHAPGGKAWSGTNGTDADRLEAGSAVPGSSVATRQKAGGAVSSIAAAAAPPTWQ